MSESMVKREETDAHADSNKAERVAHIGAL